MIALDQIVLPLPVDMPDAVEMWVISAVDLANDTPICMCFIDDACHRSLHSNALNRLVEKGSGSFCIPSSCQAEINHLAIRINSPPQLPTLTPDADVAFVHVPVDAGAAQMLLSALGQFGTEFLHPSKHGRPVNIDACCALKVGRRYPDKKAENADTSEPRKE